MATSSAISTETIDAARSGRPGAADALVEAAWPHAFRIAYGIVPDRELAQDAAQEACAILYCKIPQLRSSQAFRVWFYRIVMREAMALERRRGTACAIESEECVDVQPAILDRLDVGRALGRLTPQQRAAVVLHYYGDLNSREISGILRIPDGTVRFHLLAARRALRDLLSITPSIAAWEAADAV